MIHYLYKFERSILRPALVDGVLAPSEEQRLKYETWLHIYAKDRTCIPERMAQLVDTYNVFPIYSHLISLLALIHLQVCIESYRETIR
jgi:hypothetical protein